MRLSRQLAGASGFVLLTSMAAAHAVQTFGPFQLDEWGELRKHGLPVRLQEQPQRILEALLERPGTLVTREDLRRRLWPDDAVVGFEDGLNNAVNRLRFA